MNQHGLLHDVGLSIIAAASLGLIAFRLRLPMLIAYLAAGIVLGPHLGLGMIQSAESIATLSELGLILLMFILGLEIDVRKLMQAGKAVIINGVTQFVGCALLGAGFFAVLGIARGSYELTYMAVTCALSSTLVVVKILSDRMELDTLTSRITLGVLVIQDLWAIGFLALQPNLADLALSGIALSVGKAALLVGVALLLARYALPWVFTHGGRHPELLLVMAMGWCFAVCGAASKLNLSLEMGALVAGVTIASYPYHTEVAAKISSLRDFFITLFFVALGLQIPWPTPEVLAIAAAVIAFVLVSRLLTVFPVLHLLKYGNRASLLPALNLSQVSEFSLVVASLGVGYGHVRPELLSGFVLALVATMLTSSVLIPNGQRLYRTMNPLLEKIGLRDHVVHDVAVSKSSGAPHIVLLGFFREASSLLAELQARHSSGAGREILVVDNNPETLAHLKKIGVGARFADLSNQDTLKALGLDSARVLICTVPDHFLHGTSNLKLLQFLRRIVPDVKAVMTADTIQAARAMYEAGAAYVFVPRIVSAHFLVDVIERLQSGSEDVIRSGAMAYLTGRQEALP